MKNKLKVLIAEDDEDVLSLLSQIEGYDITTAKTGDDCFAALEKQQFDAVILDVLLPKTSGLAVLRKLKRQRPDTAVIVVTGYGEIVRSQVTAIGVDSFIEKPFTLDDITKALSAALESRGKAASR